MTRTIGVPFAVKTQMLMLASLIVLGTPGSAAADAASPLNLPGPQSISANDKALGAKSNPDMTAEFGGAYTGPQSALVRRVGITVAGQSGIADVSRDFTFTLLNSPVENAFAIPGGYVYCTRALLALMNDEAELAFVLGHETGHIAAHHADQRNKVTQRDVLLGTLGQAILGGLLGNGAAGQIGGALVKSGVNRLVTGDVMHHSRTEEFEADDLGTVFAQKAGYDPLAASQMLTALAAQTALDKTIAGDARTTPRWAMSHPDPEARVARALDRARAMGVSSGRRNGDAFLMSLNGMIYDDDPRQGVIEGQTFTYPVGRVTFTAPAGYGMSNATDAVTVSALGGNGGGQASFSGGAFTGTLDAYVGQVLTKLGGDKPVQVSPRHTTINGMDTASTTLTAQDSAGNTQDVTVVAYAVAPGQTYAFTVLTPQGSGLGALAPLVSSVRRMSAAEAAAVRARVISVVSVGRRDTVTTLAARMAYTTKARERFVVLNGLPADAERLPKGRKVKLVVWGPPGRY
ncbi:M48 family metalloprotease [Novosphingobium sp.]|uniref:M48 family metalloprotease n=1 Tax=Novosphingobium sp. TaxID=1874826 RepID=UPI00333FA8B0